MEKAAGAHDVGEWRLLPKCLWFIVGNLASISKHVIW